MTSARKYEVTFFTATVLEWKPLLANDSYKDIITESLRFLVENNRIMLHAFVIMNNHFHVLWHIMAPHKKEDIQRDMLKYISHKILRDLRSNNPDTLKDYFVGAKDRQYQIWERNPLSIALWTEDVVKQKLDYIHSNPVKSKIMCISRRIQV